LKITLKNYFNRMFIKKIINEKKRDSFSDLWYNQLIFYSNAYYRITEEIPF